MQRVIDLSKRSFIRYLVTGGSTFAMDFLLLVFFHEALKIPVVIAATLSYWISLAYNFILNKFWTFGTKENTQKHALMYGSLIVFNYFMSLGIIWLLGSYGIHYALAKICAVALAMLWNYIAYKKLIFT